MIKGFRIEAQGLVLEPGLAISFQRFPRPENGVVMESPRSFGALPVGLSGERVLVPLADDEALWLGVSREDSDAPLFLAISVRTPRGEMLDALAGTTVTEAPGSWRPVATRMTIDGIQRNGEGLWCFSRGDDGGALPCAVLVFTASPNASMGEGMEQVEVDLRPPEAFQAETGIEPPRPIDPNDAYRGWRLP